MNDVLALCLDGGGQDMALVAEAARLAALAGGRAAALVSDEAAVPGASAAGATRAALLPHMGADDLALAKALARYCANNDFLAVLCCATVRGRAVMPMAAALLNTGLTADCTALEMAPDGTLTQVRPAFGSNVLARITCAARPQMATVRPGICPPAPGGAARDIPCERLAPPAPGRVALLDAAARGAGCALAAADIVVAGGMGVGGKEGFARLAKLAGRIGAGLAATRAVVNAGWAPYCCQVGQTGVVVRPKLYIAVGISGAVQHLAGMSGADTVFALNSDAKAPIFDYADYGAVGDWQALWRRVEELL